MKRLLTLLVVLAFALPAVSFASDRLEVVFESAPLFTGVNLAPGHVNTKHFTVENTSGAEQVVRLKTINIAAGNLSDALDVRVFTGANTYFSGTLTELYREPYVDLGKLIDGAEEKFWMSVTFRTSAGDEYQNESTGFDLCVGFAGAGENCVSDTEGDQGGDEDDDNNNNENQTGTNRGGGQFIGNTSTDTSSLDLGQGDSDPLPEPDSDNLFVPVTTTVETLSTVVSQGEGAGGGQGVEEEPEPVVEDNAATDNTASNLAAAAFLGLPEGIADFARCASIFLLILLVIWLLTLGFDVLRRAPELPDRQRIQGRLAFIDVLLLAALALALFVPLPCVIIPLFITNILGIIWFVFTDIQLRQT